MTYQQIVMGKRALDQIVKLQFPVRTAYSIFKLKKRIDELFEFEVDQEMKTIDKYHGTVKRNGSITFDKKEDSEACSNEMSILLNTEIEEEIGPVAVEFDALGDATLSPEIIEELDGLIIFQ